MDLFFNIFFPIILVFFTAFSIKYLIVILTHYKVYDIPNKRSNHYYPIPKGAGLLLTLYICIAIGLYVMQEKISSPQIEKISILMLALSFFSFLDDMYSIPFLKKLFFQIFVVFLGTYLLNQEINLYCSSTYGSLILHINYDLYKIIVKITICFLWLWFLNLFNFMDGIDGITASQIITFSIGVICLAMLKQIDENFLYVGVILFAIFLGFLCYNKSPARIFLGDSGSITMGFFIASIIIITFLEHKNFTSLIILVSYYITDTTITLLKRIYKKQNIFSAHSNHFYQRKIRNGFSHESVLSKIVLINSLLIILSINYFKYPFFSIILSILMIIYLLKWLGKTEKKINANK